MHGLRVYISTVGPDGQSRRGIFYSRRDAGPYYRWFYVEEKDRWCCARVRPDLIPDSLRMAQKSVPNELRTELLAHYLD
jgi:hypothetical protein